MAQPAKVVTINLDKERHLRFNLNALILVEELTGSKLSELADQKDGLSLKFLRALLYAGLKWEDKDLTEEEVGELVDLNNMEEINEKIGESIEGLK